MEMKERTILLALHEMPGVGWLTIARMLAAVESLGELQAKSSDWLQSLGLRPSVAQVVVNGLRDRALRETSRKYEATDIVPITRYDPEYPDLLRHFDGAPWVLYATGCVELLRRPSLAIVGTRTPTVYGRRAAGTIARELSHAGLCIVSGLARGIDGDAHVGALEGPGGTIGVLGCGIDQVYPSEHRALYKRIAADGLLLSEYGPGVAAKPGLFPQRNRIIAGMTVGTLVVEAAERSGSLITAEMALEQGREVFAVPGPIMSPKSAGTHKLLQDGAVLAGSSDDILFVMTKRMGVCLPDAKNRTHQEPELTGDERKVLNMLSHEPTSIDSLLKRSETKFGHLHAILLSLLLKNKIEQLPGPAFIRI